MNNENKETDSAFTKGFFIGLLIGSVSTLLVQSIVYDFCHIHLLN